MIHDLRSRILTRIRHTGELLPATLINDKGKWSVKLDQAIKGIAEGQSAVFYQKQNDQIICLGGGVISLS